MPDGRVALRDARLPTRLTLYAADTTWSLGPGYFHNVRGGLEVDTAGVVWLTSRATQRPGPDRELSFLLRLRADGSILDTLPNPPYRFPSRKAPS
jgi:hypothetical protein